VGTDEEEVNWDEDSEDEGTDRPATATKKASSIESSRTLQDKRNDASKLRPAASRNSGENHSQADSDASYDVVSGAPSGAPSQGPGSPREKTLQEESDEDWE